MPMSKDKYMDGPDERTVNGDLCIIPECKVRRGPDYARGMCLLCYSQAKKTVDSGMWTWERLVEVGLALPESNLFTKALNNRTK